MSHSEENAIKGFCFTGAFFGAAMLLVMTMLPFMFFASELPELASTGQYIGYVALACVVLMFIFGFVEVGQIAASKSKGKH